MKAMKKVLVLASSSASAGSSDEARPTSKAGHGCPENRPFHDDGDHSCWPSTDA